MKTKKLMALLLAATVSAGCLAGCGQETSNEVESSGSEVVEKTSESTVGTSAQEETPLYNVGELPIVNEPITLKVLTQDDAVYPYEKTGDSKYWEFLEEQTGIHFEVESYTKEELASKLPLIMATPDEMPDLFIRCEFSAADVMGYGQNGQLLTMDDYIEQYCGNIQEAFDTLDYAYGAAVSPDGHIYSLPAYNGQPASVTYGMNQKWLDKVDMDAPTTIEGLYEVFKAFKADGDANGDGIEGNEIYWSDTYRAFKSSSLSMVGLNCYWPWQGCLFDAKDDEVFFVPTSDEYKYLLEWLHTFYEEGMIDTELFTHSTDELKVKEAEGRIFLGRIVESDPGASNYNGVEGAFFPEVPIGSENSEPFISIGAPYQTFIGSVAANTEYPEVCMLVLDYMFSEEVSLLGRFGKEGVDYEVVTEEPFVIKSILEGYSLGQASYGLLAPRWVRDEWIQPGATEQLQAGQDLAREYGKVAFQNYLTFTDEESEAAAIISADLGLYCDDYFVGFITGEYDLEKDWDKYVEECNAMKVDELTDIYQASYNRYYGID